MHDSGIAAGPVPVLGVSGWSHPRRRPAALSCFLLFLRSKKVAAVGTRGAAPKRGLDTQQWRQGRQPQMREAETSGEGTSRLLPGRQRPGKALPADSSAQRQSRGGAETSLRGARLVAEARSPACAALAQPGVPLPPLCCLPSTAGSTSTRTCATRSVRGPTLRKRASSAAPASRSTCTTWPAQ